MPFYDVRCEQGHVFEVRQSIAAFRRHHACRVEGCGLTATVIISRSNPPVFSVDNCDRQDFQIATGRHFNNRSERDAWLRQNKATVTATDDPVWRQMVSDQTDRQEQRREVEGRGDNYNEYMADKRQREIRSRHEELAKQGVSFQPLAPDVAAKMVSDFPDGSSFATPAGETLRMADGTVGDVASLATGVTSLDF